MVLKRWKAKCFAPNVSSERSEVAGFKRSWIRFLHFFQKTGGHGIISDFLSKQYFLIGNKRDGDKHGTIEVLHFCVSFDALHFEGGRDKIGLWEGELLRSSGCKHSKKENFFLDVRLIVVVFHQAILPSLDGLFARKETVPEEGGEAAGKQAKHLFGAACFVGDRISVIRFLMQGGLGTDKRESESDTKKCTKANWFGALFSVAACAHFGLSYLCSVSPKKLVWYGRGITDEVLCKRSKNNVRDFKLGWKKEKQIC